jgi:hypothetical protein
MSSINGAAQVVYQYVQSAPVDDQSTAGSTSSAATTADVSAAQTSTNPQVHESGHHHHHGGGEFFKQIQDAVTSALQSTAAGTSTDPNQTIEDAITQVLQNGGTSAPSTTTGVAEGASTTGNAGSTQQSFAQTLQANGVNPQQFRQDFLAALKEAQGGHVNPGVAFASFPPGVLVDAPA